MKCPGFSCPRIRGWVFRVRGSSGQGAVFKVLRMQVCGAQGPSVEIRGRFRGSGFRGAGFGAPRSEERRTMKGERLKIPHDK